MLEGYALIIHDLLKVNLLSTIVAIDGFLTYFCESLREDKCGIQ